MGWDTWSLSLSTHATPRRFSEALMELIFGLLVIILAFTSWNKEQPY